MCIQVNYTSAVQFAVHEFCPKKFFCFLNNQGFYRQRLKHMFLFNRCGQVCKSWNEIIQQDKRARFKRRAHLSEVEAALEVIFSVLVTIANCWPIKTWCHIGTHEEMWHFSAVKEKLL